MATINLGAIKFNWKGAYNNGTAYTVDDVVSSAGSSYVCIAASTGNAVSNGTYWQVMAQGGTDLTSTITTQGDVLYRDGSGLARLAAGTSGQVLTTGGSGANPTWGTVASGAKWGQHVIFDMTSALAGITSINTYASWATPFQVSITPTATSSKVLVRTGFQGSIGGCPGKYSIHQGSTLLKETGIYASSSYYIGMEILHSANTTSAITYETKAAVTASGGHNIYVYSGSGTPPFQAWMSATEILA